MIDSLITSIDRIQARHRCKLFLNACSFTESTLDTVEEDVVADKKFEIAVLGCTLDDQKVVKKRLQALMSYLNKQTISDWVQPASHSLIGRDNLAELFVEDVTF